MRSTPDSALPSNPYKYSDKYVEEFLNQASFNIGNISLSFIKGKEPTRFIDMVYEYYEAGLDEQDCKELYGLFHSFVQNKTMRRTVYLNKVNND